MPPKATSPGSIKITHPLYGEWASQWLMALDVYEGRGGFLDEKRPYLVPHPREWLDHSVPKKDGTDHIIGFEPNPNPSLPSPKLKMRRKLARYENVAAAILDILTGSLFFMAPQRTVAAGKEDLPVQQWWANCDGLGTSLTAFMQDSWTVAGVFGHAIILSEKETEPAQTAADMALPRLCRYTPLDLIDWLEDEYGELTAVKLVEPAPRTSFDTRLKITDLRVRVVDQTTWTLYDNAGMQIATGEHGYGRLPVEILYGKRRLLTPRIGKAIMGDPQLYIDLYNLTSEVRELLRNQTFAILNVPVGKDGSAENEQKMIGQQSGTANVLFTSEKAAFLSPDGTNVEAYHTHLDRLARMIYRLASVPWDGDARAPEAAESRRLKRQDMNSLLLKFCGELQRTDRNLNELFYRATVGADGWKAAFDADEVSVAYPTQFEAVDPDAIAKAAADTLALELGETATKEIKKRIAQNALPDLDKSKVDQINTEIDAMKVLTADEKQKQLLEQSAARLGAKPGFKPVAA